MDTGRAILLAGLAVAGSILVVQGLPVYLEHSRYVELERRADADRRVQEANFEALQRAAESQAAQHRENADKAAEVIRRNALKKAEILIAQREIYLRFSIAYWKSKLSFLNENEDNIRRFANRKTQIDRRIAEIEAVNYSDFMKRRDANLQVAELRVALANYANFENPVGATALEIVSRRNGLMIINKDGLPSLQIIDLGLGPSQQYARQKYWERFVPHLRKMTDNITDPSSIKLHIDNLQNMYRENQKVVVNSFDWSDFKIPSGFQIPIDPIEVPRLCDDPELTSLDKSVDFCNSTPFYVQN